MTRYAANTSVSSAKSKAEIEQIVERYGAAQFISGWSESTAIIGFTMEGRQVKFVLPMSVGLGTAILGEPRNGLEIAEEFGVPRANDSDRDEHANWGWPMLDIEAWPEPMRKQRGLERAKRYSVRADNDPHWWWWGRKLPLLRAVPWRPFTLAQRRAWYREVPF